MTPICFDGPEDRARLARIAVGLAEMDPVGVEPLGQADAVVDDEGDVGVGADPLQRLGQPRQLMLSTPFTRSWNAATGPPASAAFSRSGKSPPTSCGLIR